MTHRFSPRCAAWTALVLTASLLPAQVGGQLNELAVEVGGSRVAPPVGVEGDAARYLVAGLRFTRFAANGTGMNGSVLLGRSADGATGGNYLAGGLSGAVWGAAGRGWHIGMEGRGYAFDVEEPFAYRTVAVEGGPALQYRGRRLTGTIKGVAGAGRSRTQVLEMVEGDLGGRHHTRDWTTEQLVTFEEDLWRYGAEAELLLGNGTLAAGIAAGAHRTPAGQYRSAGATVLAGRGGRAVELRVDYWKTPIGTQTTGGLAFVVPFGAWGLRGFFGRSEPDPLTLTEPGSDSGGMLLSRRLVGGPSGSAGARPLYRVVEAGPSRATVTIEVEAPRSATSVEVLGDFTRWEPVAMHRDGSRWQISLEAPVGVHHFGFLVDGEWFLPADTPDAVPDEWGRHSATMVIER